jgi:hypothetical protein
MRGKGTRLAPGEANATGRTFTATGLSFAFSSLPVAEEQTAAPG